MSPKDESKKQLVALAPFVYVSFPGMPAKEVKAGEVFVVPENWTRDTNAEQITKLEKQKKNGAVPSPIMIFQYEGEIVNPTEKNKSLQERRVHTVVLPLEER